MTRTQEAHLVTADGGDASSERHLLDGDPIRCVALRRQEPRHG